MKDQARETTLHSNAITYFLNGQRQQADIPAGITTLEWLHDHLHLHGTKCSCNEGDCGACTVVIAKPFEGQIVYEAINSCLYPAAKLHGRHLITVEGLGTPEQLHPIQQALLDHHGTQCGYCTPGFVMSMFALFAMHPHPSREMIMAHLEGNLCRCTGYVSILEAAEELSLGYDPDSIVPAWCREVEAELFGFKRPAAMHHSIEERPRFVHRYLMPENIKELFDYIAVERDAVFIAGGTDIMVQRNISRKPFPVLIDLTRIEEMHRLYLQADGLHIGAAVSYSDLLASGIVKHDYPVLHGLIRLIASQQIRNFGTLAGNIANTSPVGDSIPLLMAMGANLRLQTELEIRILPLGEFFLGYRKTDLRKGEFIREVIIPKPLPGIYLRTTKSAKRKSVDISAVLTAVAVHMENEHITSAVLALGGMAATPVLSKAFSIQLLHKTPDELDEEAIAQAVADEFSPLSDVRGSAEYRLQLVKNHLLTYLQDIKGAKA